MKNLQTVLCVFVCTLLFRCDTTNDNQIPEPPLNLKATYKVTFEFNWNEQDYPIDYPSNAHFSKLIGWSHTPLNNFFKIGTIASTGIKNMAELGATVALDEELASKIEANEGFDRVIGSGLSSGIGEISVELQVNEEYPSISLVTMLAPSPDWYVDIVDLNLIENGVFIEEKTIYAKTYDAGTDSGQHFTSNNAPTSPKIPITIINNPSIGNGGTIATVNFKKQ